MRCLDAGSQNVVVTPNTDHVIRVAHDDVSAEDVSRLINDRFLFEKWGWKLADLYAVAPGQLPILVGETYQKLKNAGAK